MTVLAFLNILSSWLLVGLPIFFVARFGLRGVVWASLLFWLLGTGWSFVQWHFAHSYSSFWLVLGFPAGLIYCVVIYLILKLTLWLLGRVEWRDSNRPVGTSEALVLAVLLTLLGWQCRPYGMGASSMINSVEQCPPNVIAFVWNDPNYFHNCGGIDLEKRTYQIGGSDESDGGSITLTMGGACTLETGLNPMRMAAIQQSLETMPRTHKFFFQRYDFTQNIYVTVWRNGSRDILVYRRNDLPEEVAELFRTLDPRVLTSVKDKAN